MLKIKRTDAQDQDFLALIKQLDKELAVTDGEDHAFYDQFNQVDSIKHVVVAYLDGAAIGCGAIKSYADDDIEVKRMYTLSEGRGKGVASAILVELESWAKALNGKRCILETGIRQQSAIALYKKNGYQLIKNYGQYADVSESFCFAKAL